MKIKAVLFDLGETIFNYGSVDIDALFRQGARLTYDYLRKCAQAAPRLPKFERYHRRHIFSIKWHYFWSILRNREFDCLALLDKRARALGLRLQRSQLEELAWLWYEPLGNTAQVEPDLTTYLQSFRDMSLKLAIISNTFIPGFVLDRHLERFNLLGFFPTRIYSADTIFRKPDRHIYQIALQRLGVLPSEAVMIGDKIREDIRGSARLGITPVYKRGSTNHRKRIPSHIPVIDKIAELPGLIRSWNKSDPPCPTLSDNAVPAGA